VLIQFGFVTIVPKYLNFATFSKDLLAVSHHGMAWHGMSSGCTDGGDILQMGRIAMNILNK